MKDKGSVTAIAALLTFLVFALGILGVLLGGAGIYERLNAENRKSYDSRTCAQYLATKVRQAPEGITVDRFGQGDALVIPEGIDGRQYLTRVYCQDGWLMELFCAAEGDFSPGDGEKILPARALELQLEDGLLRIRIQDSEGNTAQLALSLRTGEGAQP